MGERVELETLLKSSGADPAGQLRVFGLLNLGVIESLSNGSISATDAVRSFYNIDNSLYVRNAFKSRQAGKVMSHGGQLADLFDALPAEEAHREFLHELSAMKALCLKLVEGGRLVA